MGRVLEELAVKQARAFSPDSSISSSRRSLWSRALDKESAGLERQPWPSRGVAVEADDDGHAVLFRWPVLVPRVAADASER